jgi:CheY-like chemotaxis protein
LIQTELNGTENRLQVTRLLRSLGYRAYVLTDGETLRRIEEVQLSAVGNADFYFKIDET